MFTLSRQPQKTAARVVWPGVPGHDPATSIVTTLREEKKHNSFLRLTSPTIIAKLRESFPDLPEQPDPQTVFTRLREMRNKW